MPRSRSSLLASALLVLCLAGAGPASAQETGIAGEIDVVVEGQDLTQPAAVKWMRDYQAAVKKRFGGGSGRAPHQLSVVEGRR